MPNFQSFLVRLSSRKFLLAVAAFLLFMSQHQWSLAAASAGAYVAVEGYLDVTANAGTKQPPTG